MGEVDENKINNMSYVFFQSVLEALGKKISFESLSNLYGKTVFDKKGGEEISKTIAAANPLVKNGGVRNTGVMGLIGQIKVVDATKNPEAAKKEEKKIFGDMSWAEGLM